MTFTTRPELQGTLGMVTSTHWLASAVGMKLLEAGGNAFDAAVATGFVLNVVEPQLNGPLGDMPAPEYSSLGNRQQVTQQGDRNQSHAGNEESPLGAEDQKQSQCSPAITKRSQVGVHALAGRRDAA